MYSVNWNAFIQDKTPSALRKPKFLAWLNALLTPIKTLHTAFALWRVAQERHVSITPQVRILRYWLNEYYDSADRRFLIEDAVANVPVRIFGQSENRPLYLPKFLSGRSWDFTVVAPCEAYSQRFFIIAFLDAYKLAGKRYKLIFRDSGGGLCPLIGIPDYETI